MAELRAYLQLQQQLHETQLAVERTRKEAEELASQNTETLSGRLKGIEQSLAAQRAKELDAMQSSNRAMLIVAGSFAGIGFVAMVLMGYFQWRTVNRLAELSAMIPASAAALGWQGKRPLALGPGGAEVLATTGSSVSASGPAGTERLNVALLETIERLEKRVHELETSRRNPLSNGAHIDAATPADPVPPDAKSGDDAHGSGQGVEDSVADILENGVGSPGHDGPGDGAGGTTDAEPGSRSAKVISLLEQGQTLLDMEQTDDALACFEEALKLDPHHPEAMVKKGTALEKQRKFTDAIEWYDKAIAADSTMTIAYLYKGGLFNRMERFSDALRCYEKALQTQEARGA